MLNQFSSFKIKAASFWRSNRRLLVVSSGLLLIGMGGYLLFIINSPNLIRRPAVNVAQLPTVGMNSEEYTNQIIVPKINVSIPFAAGDASALHDGAWWRHPQRGNPIEGGNFILSAHRFRAGTTPSDTLHKSPFYDIDQLEIDDEIVIFYDSVRYDYQVSDIYQVAPDAIEIEAPSSQPKLTLYSCTLGGSHDGRVVIEAKQISD